VDHRSPFRPISTSVPGLQLTELLTHTARIANKLTIVRSMTHKVSDHSNGSAYVLQGYPPGASKHPDIGSVVAHRIGTAAPWLPPYVMVPGNSEQNAVSTSAFLPAARAAFKTGGRDLSDASWRVPNLGLHPSTDSARFEGRHVLLESLNGRSVPGDGPAGMNTFYRQAFKTLQNPAVDAAFDLKREPASVREKYGRGHRGACYLLSRKLIEAGVRFMTVDTRWPLTPETPGGFNLNWDHHDAIYAKGSCGTVRDKAGGEGRYGIGHWCMMGSTDVAFAALIEDLDQRGLLEETLVCFVTEFGRTPRLNKFQGRDHWPHAYSVALAGAGLTGGRVIGSTDREGGHVQDRAASPADFAATLYQALGIDPVSRITMKDGRSVDLTDGGEPIHGLLG
jgi:hypothetical protein